MESLSGPLVAAAEPVAFGLLILEGSVLGGIYTVKAQGQTTGEGVSWWFQYQGLMVVSAHVGAQVIWWGGHFRGALSFW